MRLILLGPPGAGKGTLANVLKKSLGLSHISTGDILREEIKNNTSLGKEAKKFIDDGQLVPDELVTKLIEQKLKSKSGIGQDFLLDGFPRTSNQAKDLDKILISVQKPMDYILYLDTSLPIIIKRLTGRRVCRNCGSLFHVVNRLPKEQGICDQCGGVLYQRPDDNEETIKTRMNVYMKSTKPIIEYYKKQGKLKTLNADREVEELYEILVKIFNEDGKLN